MPGLNPKRQTYGSFASFSDPDGNRGFFKRSRRGFQGEDLSLDLATLTELLRETEKQHGDHEPAAPKHHWSEWYAGYINARERGRTADEAATEATLRIEGARETAQA